MTKSSTKSQTHQTISQRIDRLLNFTPDVKIKKLENGAVQVNDIVVENLHGAWQCRQENFYRRKSAVGYALCLINDDHHTAKNIKLLDSQLLKYKADIDIYYYHMKKGNKKQRIIMSNRISNDMPLLLDADQRLTSLLKTVKV